MKNEKQAQQTTKLKDSEQLHPLKLEQLDRVVGGSIKKIPGMHKVSDITLKRG